MLKDILKDSLKNLIKGIGRFLLLFLVLTLIFLFIQPNFPPIVTILLGIGVVWYAHSRFMKTSFKVFRDILDAGKANRGANHKSYGNPLGQNPDGDKYNQAYIYNEIKEADELNVKRSLDKIIRTDYRKDEYIRKLRPVVKKNFYHLNDEELHKLCNILADISKELEEYLYSPQEMVEALYSYMEFARLSITNAFGDVNKALEYFRTVYKWATPETESYRERLKPIIEEKYGYLKPYEKNQLCKTICEVARLRDKYGHSPEEVAADINLYVIFARIDIRDVIGHESSILQYFREKDSTLPTS